MTTNQLDQLKRTGLRRLVIYRRTLYLALTAASGVVGIGRRHPTHCPITIVLVVVLAVVPFGGLILTVRLSPGLGLTVPAKTTVAKKAGLDRKARWVASG